MFLERNAISKTQYDKSLGDLIQKMEMQDVVDAIKSIENEMLCYDLTKEVIDAFYDIVKKQWDMTKTLPQTWEFDNFTLEEYRLCWIWLCTLCYIHLFSGLNIRNPLIRLKNATIIQNKSNIINVLKDCREDIQADWYGLQKAKEQQQTN